ncbi:MAG: hypothetical protein II453_11510 [Alphaproteobacteria bacterium]|nr:hypothetical protein [Alphaproteobacteria bacterium]
MNRKDRWVRLNLRLCHYCNGKPDISTKPDLNYIGEQGFKSTVKCESCGLIVERWAKTYLQAQQKAVKNWNGVYNDE